MTASLYRVVQKATGDPSTKIDMYAGGSFASLREILTVEQLRQHCVKKTKAPYRIEWKSITETRSINFRLIYDLTILALL